MQASTHFGTFAGLMIGPSHLVLEVSILVGRCLLVSFVPSSFLSITWRPAEGFPYALLPIFPLFRVSFLSSSVGFMSAYMDFQRGEGRGISFLRVRCVIRPIPQGPESAGLSYDKIKWVVVVLEFCLRYSLSCMRILPLSNE